MSLIKLQNKRDSAEMLVATSIWGLARYANFAKKFSSSANMFLKNGITLPMAFIEKVPHGSTKE